MSDLVKQLRASVVMDAINGDSFERGICGKQMRQAADLIEQLQAERDALAAHIERVKNYAKNECSGYEPSLSVLFRMIEEESPQTSLAEVKAKQAHHSFNAGRLGLIRTRRTLAT